MAENQNVTRRDNRPDSTPVSAAPALTREAPVQQRVVGHAGNVHRRRLYDYDRADGFKTKPPLQGGVVRMDRLGDDDYRRRAAKLDSMFGINSATPNGERVAYHDMLYIAYALLGGSQVSPNSRASFTVGGVERPWSIVADYWADDLRRAYRTVADDVVRACKDLWYNFSPENPDEVFLRDEMYQLARMRDLTRYPWLIADCADAAHGLSPDELAAVMRSKAAVISSGLNAVDSRSLAVPIQTRDGYDSSNHRTVSALAGNNNGLEYRT